MDQIDHGEGKAGVETSPEVQKFLYGFQAFLGESIVPDKDLEPTSCPTETLLVEVMDIFGRQAGSKVFMDVLGVVTAWAVVGVVVGG